MWSRPRLDTVERALRDGLPASEGAADPTTQGTRHAAVAAILRESSQDLEVLLIRRALREGDPWSGHMALPGGHVNPGGESALEAAVRETREEVGVDLSQSRVLGSLRLLRPMSGLALDVRPFCFGLERSVDLELGDEVSEALWVPLGPLALGSHDSSYRFPHAGAQRAFPAWDVGGRVVWGMTYRLLSELLELIRRARSHPA